ncbi:MAG TPA: allophanate hydrolase [Tepidisphaeraceae bacterium]|jgi:allophanate hydrolase|nr:allophanate hydrolase [Tepidisphaeraceae bacterium]HEV8603937.1 allophanate hydrolase [Tepidisphaeraceae bacterium]
MQFPSLDLHTLETLYAGSTDAAADFLVNLLKRIDTYPDPAVWITRLSTDDVIEQLRQAEQCRAAGLAQPLFGIPFAVKDNIDVANYPTTAACPDFAYTPSQSATVVQRLIAAGAILIGKTNMDQFATGLVGVRSPYGACRNAFNPDFISGGSSSGSAVAVAAGLVSFSLGTDTAGSGRVPAALNNIIGLKPTRGLISTTGVVPACRSLDCVSIFALTCHDANQILSIAAAHDRTDPYSIHASALSAAPTPPLNRFRVGVLPPAQEEFFGNQDARDLYRKSIDHLNQLVASVIEIDYTPFRDAAKLLYQGPWVAERLSAIRPFLDRNPDALLPITRSIIETGRNFSAVDAFRGQYHLQSLIQSAAAQWEKIDLLMLPTVGTTYRIADIERDPLQLNSNLGYYTNFVNLMDLCALAVPAGFLPSGIPVGVSFIAKSGHDHLLINIGEAFHRLFNALGATVHKLPNSPTPCPQSDWIKLAVVGAHLSGQPLNHQLTDRRAHLVRAGRTAPLYRLYALEGTNPPKPGLIRTNSTDGASIELEVWELPPAAFANFVAAIPPPLGIGTIRLDDGSDVKGFLCEPYVIQNARDISHLGGWRQFLCVRGADDAG